MLRNVWWNNNSSYLLITFSWLFQAPEGVIVNGYIISETWCYYDEFYKYHCNDRYQYETFKFNNVTDARGTVNFQFKAKSFTSIRIQVFPVFSVFFCTFNFLLFQVYSSNAKLIATFMTRTAKAIFKTEILTKKWDCDIFHQ